MSPAGNSVMISSLIVVAETRGTESSHSVTIVSSTTVVVEWELDGYLIDTIGPERSLISSSIVVTSVTSVTMVVCSSSEVDRDEVEEIDVSDKELTEEILAPSRLTIRGNCSSPSKSELYPNMDLLLSFKSVVIVISSLAISRNLLLSFKSVISSSVASVEKSLSSKNESTIPFFHRM